MSTPLTGSQLPIAGAPPVDEEDPLDLMEEIDALKGEKNAVILAHYYVDSEIQDIADYNGDSLQLARDAASCPFGAGWTDWAARVGASRR